MYTFLIIRKYYSLLKPKSHINYIQTETNNGKKGQTMWFFHFLEVTHGHSCEAANHTLFQCGVWATITSPLCG